MGNNSMGSLLAKIKAELFVSKYVGDGGPGSGNFGHKGRPGKVGGSGPGGGKGSGSLYRHEKKGVGFFGTRKDWLNGLEGEAQHKAAKSLAHAKERLEGAKKHKEKIEDLRKRGILTYAEYDDVIKNSMFSGIESMTPEEFIVSHGTKEEKGELIEHISKARNWEDHKDKYLQNLTDEEQKAFAYVDRNFNRLDDVAKNEFFQLKAKAMGFNVEPKISDSTLIGAGLKEAPKKPEEPEKPEKAEKPEPDYGWWDKRKEIPSSMEGYMGTVTGDPVWAKRWGSNKDEFVELHKKFLDTVKYGRLSPLKCKYALKAMAEVREFMGWKKDERDGYDYPGQLTITSDMVNRLDDSEKSKLLNLINSESFESYERLEDVKADDFSSVESSLMTMALRSKEEQQLVRDYVTLMDKMLTGETPSEENPVEKKKKADKEAKEKARKEFIAQRDKEQKEFVDSGKAKAKREVVKKVAAIDSKKIMKMDHEGVKKAVMDSGMFRDGSRFEYSEEVPSEVYGAAVLAYKKVVERFPFLAGELGGFGDNYEHATAGCSIMAYGYDTEILINNDKFSDPKGYLERRKSIEARNGYVKTDDDLPPGYADVMHELGHALSNWLHRYMYGEFQKNNVNGYDNEVATQLKRNVLKKLGIEPTFDNIKDEVSVYAAASRNATDARQPRSKTLSNEFFAECFAELMCSSHPRRVAVEFGKQLDAMIKSAGITVDSSATTPVTLPKKEY